MSNPTRNSLTSILPATGVITGYVTISGGTPTITALTGTNALDRSQVSITDGGTGTFTLVATQFKGPQGYGMATGNTVSGTVQFASSVGSYSGTTLSVAVSIVDTITNATSDTNFMFTLWAW